MKQNFYKLHKAEQEAARKAFIDGGGAPRGIYSPTDDAESRFKDISELYQREKEAPYKQNKIKKKKITW